MRDLNQVRLWTGRELVQRIFKRNYHDGVSILERVEALSEQKALMHEAFMRSTGTENDERQYLKDVEAYDLAIDGWNQFGKRTLLAWAQNGKVLGSGYPSLSHPAPVFIPPHQWHFLSLDLSSDTADGHGLHYAGIRFIQLAAEGREALLAELFAPTAPSNPPPPPPIARNETQSKGGSAKAEIYYGIAAALSKEIAESHWRRNRNYRLATVAAAIRKEMEADLRKFGLNSAVSVDTLKDWIRLVAPPEARQPGRGPSIDDP